MKTHTCNIEEHLSRLNPPASKARRVKVFWCFSYLIFSYSHTHYLLLSFLASHTLILTLSYSHIVYLILFLGGGNASEARSDSATIAYVIASEDRLHYLSLH